MDFVIHCVEPLAMIRRARTLPVKGKRLSQQIRDFAAEVAPDPDRPGESTKAVAPANPGLDRLRGSALRRQAGA